MKRMNVIIKIITCGSMVVITARARSNRPWQLCTSNATTSRAWVECGCDVRMTRGRNFVAGVQTDAMGDEPMIIPGLCNQNTDIWLVYFLSGYYETPVSVGIVRIK